MNRPHDVNLREQFAALRHEDAVGVPPLDAMLARARQRHTARRSFKRWVPTIGVAAVGTLLAVAILRPGSERQPLVSLAAARWQGPTDFLLRVPGAEYLASVPSIGNVATVFSDSLP